MYSLIDITDIEGNSGWILSGEIDKWITFSNQRFVSINDDGQTLEVEIYGAVNETVNIAFIDLNNQNKQTIVQCVIGDTQRVIISMPGQKVTASE